MSDVRAYPVTFEVYDESSTPGTLLARVNQFDEECSEVVLQPQPHNPESWQKLANEIHACLLKMHAKEDGK